MPATDRQRRAVPAEAGRGHAPPPEAPRLSGRTVWRRGAPALVSVVLVVAVFWYFLPQFTSLSAVWSAMRGMTPIELTSIGVAALWNLASYLLVMVATMPGLTSRQAAVVTESSTAVSNTVPGGGAIGIALSYAMFDSWGFSRSRSSVSMLVSGIVNNFCKLGLPVFALALLALQGDASGSRVVAGLAGIGGLIAALGVFVVMLRSPETARRVGEVAQAGTNRVLRLLRRPPARGWHVATVKFRSRTILLLRARWIWITIASLISHLSLYLVLLLALRHLGVSDHEVGWAEVLAVFAFARLLTAVPLTPGGLGIVEVALITGLSAAGGPRPEVAAAVLLFRAVTYVLPIPLGLLTYVFWRRNTSWRREPGRAPRTSLVPEQLPEQLPEPVPEQVPAAP